MNESASIMEQLNGVLVSKEQAPFIHRRVERLAARAGIAKPAVYVIPTELPNACAAGTSENDMAVAVTAGLIKNLDENEIDAVLAHEVGHIQCGHSIAKTKVAMKALAVSAVASLAGRHVLTSDIDFTPGDGESDDVLSSILKIGGGVLVEAAGTAMAGGMLTAVSFDSEFQADEAGGRLSKKPWALARALEKLETLTSSGAESYKPEVCQLFIVSPAYLHHQTHPATSERIAKLRGMCNDTAGIASVPTLYCAACGEKTDADGKYCYWCGFQFLE